MSGALKMLKAMLLRDGESELVRRAEQAVGERFLTAAENPKMFVKPKDLGKDNDSILRNTGGSFQELSNGSFLYYPSAGGAALHRPVTVARHMRSDLHRDAPWLTPQAVSELPVDGNFYRIDTADLHQGTGAGKEAYGAIYQRILNDPKGHNFTDALTDANVLRRNYNMGAALMRDQKAGRRILLDSDQAPHHKNIDVGEFRYRYPEEQLGVLQSEAALGVLERLQRLAGLQQDPNRRGALARIAEDLTTAQRPEYWRGAAELIRTPGKGGPQHNPGSKLIGPSALKRAAIVNDLLDGKSIEPSFFEQLEFRHGGSTSQAGHGGVGALHRLRRTHV